MTKRAPEGAFFSGLKQKSRPTCYYDLKINYIRQSVYEG